jgi:hypothetical protein
MKRLYVLTLIGFISLWPVIADEASPHLRSAEDVEMAFTEIDLRIALKLYEKLKTELMEVSMQYEWEAGQLPEEMRQEPAKQDKVVRQKLDQLLRRTEFLQHQTMMLREQARRLGQAMKDQQGTNTPPGAARQER